ncbi:hypothetical protein D0Z07_4485 [Hyphodiscus hymeniophilus]|uniref:Uncharacterized protein n=1 Tax=Hyphodiscus hymeniophilus TaxID=353542 RepID=A0A9P6VK46_9HELO|nr:hypothetical protein D0Z07_4485 [Hyphodiscus hymeniophilus]
MVELRDRISAIEWALRNQEEIDIGGQDTPVRHSLDHQFDRPDPELDAKPYPTPAQEKPNPFESASPVEDKHYDSIAAKFGLGILDEEDFTEYTVYDAFVTNLRICPVHLTDNGRYYYVEHRAFLANVPGVIVRSGIDKKGKCLGAAHIPFQGVNTFGIGDIENSPHTMIWEKMGCPGFWTHMKYEFVHEIPNGQRRTFNWLRTRNNIYDDQGDLVLVEQGREDLILAEYMGKGLLKWKKRGRLRIKAAEIFGDAWELVVLVTWASVTEVCGFSISKWRLG